MDDATDSNPQSYSTPILLETLHSCSLTTPPPLPILDVAVIHAFAQFSSKHTSSVQTVEYVRRIGLLLFLHVRKRLPYGLISDSSFLSRKETLEEFAGEVV